MRIAIFGYGFVGSAYQALLDPSYELAVVDPPKGLLFDDTAKDADCVVIAIPAPTTGEGDVDITDILAIVDAYPEHVPILIKSSIPPSKVGNLPVNVTYSPEYLRAAHSVEDLFDSRYMVFGGGHANFWVQVMAECLPWIDMVETSAINASFMKYTVNSFLALKVSFMNEIETLHKTMSPESRWIDLAELLKLDPRLGTSHYSVPGDDGQYGFGGACFPKDTKAFTAMANEKESPLKLIETAIDLNKVWRNDDA